MGCCQSTSEITKKEERRGSSSAKPIPHVFKQKYKIGDTLGEGAFSVVKAAVDKQTGKRVAVKTINRTNLPVEDEIALKQEVEILTSLNHPNIVKCFDFFEEEKYYYVVMEILEGGELFDRIVKKTFYNEKEARDLVQILLGAIKFCHDHDIVHRDLKPENLLLTSASDDANIKLADFGFAVKAMGLSSLTTQCGTPGYVAPEILLNMNYGKPVDMWSIGVITFILLGGYPPFHDDDQRKLFKKIKKADFEFHPEYWGSVSEEAKDLIKRLLTLNPEKRLTAEGALAHSWVQRDAKELETRNLGSNLEKLRKYHATRKLRAAVRAVMVVNRMGLSNLGSLSEDDDFVPVDLEARNESVESQSNVTTTVADDDSIRRPESTV